ncbi:MAG: hypothetical protein WCD81_02110 [Candidatus Bathyarchaeia archaeon]
MSNRTGRPKKEHGHKRRNLSLNEFTNYALDIIKPYSNMSKFVEEELRPGLISAIHKVKADIMKDLSKDKSLVGRMLYRIFEAVFDVFPLEPCTSNFSSLNLTPFVEIGISSTYTL